MTQSGEGELHCQLRRRVFMVQAGIDLSQIDAEQAAGFGHHLHQQVRFAVSQAARDGRADAGRLGRVNGVHVEAEAEAVRVARDRGDR